MTTQTSPGPTLMNARPSLLPQAPTARKADSWLQRTGRRLLLGRLASLRDGHIAVVENGQTRHFGSATAGALSATVEVLHPQFWADAAFNGSTGAGEAYIHGLWRCDDLVALVRIMVRNRAVLEQMEGGPAIFSAPLRRALHWMNRNSRDGSRRNIAAHYDLGNSFFELFLDPTMAYSCALFEADTATLEQASIAKFDAVCRKLDLRPTDHLLEIGTGWGGLAIHAARHYGCRVTTTTISRQQHAMAAERIAAAGLSDRIELRLDDYRDLTGQYDKLVSIEMIEAVGHQYLPAYLAKCASLLKPDGAFLLQAITLQDQIYEDALERVDFIQRYVFPGSFIPSITAITSAATAATDLKVAQLQDIGPHYARTLHLWRDNFFANIAKVRELGYPEEFIRLWDYYLCYCEGGFAERQLGDIHMLLVKPDWRG